MTTEEKPLSRLKVERNRKRRQKIRRKAMNEIENTMKLNPLFKEKGFIEAMKEEKKQEEPKWEDITDMVNATVTSFQNQIDTYLKILSSKIGEGDNEVSFESIVGPKRYQDALRIIEKMVTAQENYVVKMERIKNDVGGRTGEVSDEDTIEFSAIYMSLVNEQQLQYVATSGNSTLFLDISAEFEMKAQDEIARMKQEEAQEKLDAE